MEQQIMAAVAQERLGGHQGTYQPREFSSYVGTLSFVTVLFGVFGIGSIVADGPLWLSLVCTPLAVGAALLAVQAAYRAAHKDRVQLDLFENGLTYIGHDGKLSAFRWDSVQVKQSVGKQLATGGSVSHTSFSYRLIGPGGNSIKIDGSNRGNTAVDEWGQAIQDAVTSTQLPEAIGRFQQGHTLQFGALSISWDAVTVKGKALPWTQIDGMYTINGQLMVQAKGSSRRRTLMMIAQIPNFYVLYALLELRLRSTV